MMRENTHMEHFEDLLFESWGSELLEKFKVGEVDYTRKWDLSLIHISEPTRPY